MVLSTTFPEVANCIKKRHRQNVLRKRIVLHIGILDMAKTLAKCRKRIVTSQTAITQKELPVLNVL